MKNKIFYLLISLLLASCLEENIQPLDISFNNTLDVINFAETNGNFINSENNPALIGVDEVFTNLGSDLVLDIRESSLFIEGHIPGALNISPAQITNYIDTANISKYRNVILVSKSGQKAAYITSLLRIVGYNNIYSLDYGMGYWHEQFAIEWQQNKKNSLFAKSYYTLQWPNKEEPTVNYNTPNLQFDSESKTIKEKIINRINYLISNYKEISNISIEEFDNKFNVIPYYFGYGSTFIICYDHELRRGLSPAEPLLYNAYKIYPQSMPRPSPSNPPITHYRPARSRTVRPLGAFLYNGQSPEYDFRSGTLLFTLPNDREILIYSYNGQRSAYITAYLNLLGYNAKFIYFGAHSMMSSYFISSEINGTISKNNLDTVYYPSPFSKYAFWEDNIRNYSFETGQ